jgi:gliding motility-associated-like protein
MYKLIKLTVILLFPHIMIAQGEVNNWYFGDHAGITFNSGAPTVLTDGVLFTEEGCATISDSSGQLLFYTDGRTVYNRQHNIMPNGTELFGHRSSTQSAIIVPLPNNNNLYYIFTVDYQAGPNGLRYSIVDMSLDNGLGDVTDVKNELLLTTVSEKINAVLHANGQDIWVITHGFGNNNFYAYLVTENGINTVPIISSTGVIVPVDPTGAHAIGVLKASPSGNKLVLCVAFVKTQLFDFDSATGMVSNPIDIYEGYVNYGAEFSPMGNLLYVTHHWERDGLWQYDLTSTDIAGSGQLIYLLQVPNSTFGQMQIGPDNKIYVASFNSHYLGVINEPNALGLACDFDRTAIYLEGRRSKSGLPTFIQSYFYVGFQFDQICLGEETLFNANISQTYDSLLWDFGDGNTSTEENPTHTYDNFGSYTVTLTVVSGAQTVTDAKTVAVYEPPTITPIVTLKQCDDDIDGYTAFNLNEAIETISANSLNETITFYQSQLDAENLTNPITNTTAYINQNVSTDTVWASVKAGNGCVRTAQINLVVTTTQVPINFTRDIYACDDDADGDNTNGITSFNFSAVSAEIEALFPVGQQLIITYYSNITDALAETNAIADITDYRNTDSPFFQAIYLRVDSLLDNECLGLGHHITLHVESVPVAHPVDIEAGCAEDGENMYAFDTSSIESEIIEGQTDVIVTYIDEDGLELPSPLPNPFLTGTQTITARVTNALSQDAAGACYAETTLNFMVHAAAVAHSISPITACDGDNDGIYAFDTSNIESTILNGQTGMQVIYTDEQGNLLTSPLPNPLLSASQSINVRVQNSFNSSCFDETTISLIVYQQPIAHSVANDFVCDDVSNDGEEVFDLSNYNGAVLGAQSSLDFEILYFSSETAAINNLEALPNLYVVNSTSQTIYARIQNINNQECFDLTSFQVGVHYLPIAYQPEALVICDDERNDGVELFDLTTQNTFILNGQSQSDHSISYHLTLEEAQEGINPLTNNFSNTVNPQIIYVRVENINSPDCYSITNFELLVEASPILEMHDLWTICAGGTVQIIADEGYDYYSWSTGETTRVITVTEPGEYTVTASNVYETILCASEKVINVVLSDIAIITQIETVDWSQDANTIAVVVEGYGDYEYSLDGLFFQDSNMFSGLSPNEYTVYVRDKNGCGIATDDVYLIYYPRFFTPNGDGHNDFWQIKSAAREPLNKLFIYDRYGKLIKQLKPSDVGWDGTLNGKKLPTNDYWFLLERQNGKTYTGHFTLKR